MRILFEREEICEKESLVVPVKLPGVRAIIMGDIKSPLGIKRPRVKNSRSGVKVIMKSALRAPGDRYGVYLYYKRGRFVLCPYAPKLLHPDIHILKSVPTYRHRASGKR